ncbi:putative haemolysin co-regulated protein (Hcp-like) [Xenorhabdus bovienii str. feltiae Moldova]|uniref:Putative haemolysin co-regulated protein (Hcp-like) n=1 Tax=Xenorhabdus bovienii str. feltiae Moldova TaxID=1398200 RepID=A0A077NPH9_XENBV|nr:putative haemolysin co-regulated protein (Hcp-like) [Xenorhabdus bovienii str. feltiae Moldova]
MSHIIYLSLKGKKQGLISAGCSTPESIGNRYQAGREDEIQVLSIIHTVSRDQNAHHHPVSFTKPIDKSSPLLAMAIDGNELLEAVFLSYRTSSMGQLEAFYEIKLTGATIVDFACHYPHSINSNDQIPYETVQLDYKSISCRHLIAGTSGYSITQLAGREEGRPLLSGFTNVKPLKQPLVEETSAKPSKHHVRYRFTDDNGNLLAEHKYRVCLPDGQVKEGKTDKQGYTQWHLTDNKNNLEFHILKD